VQITKQNLKKIIKEEARNVLEEELKPPHHLGSGEPVGHAQRRHKMGDTPLKYPELFDPRYPSDAAAMDALEDRKAARDARTQTGLGWEDWRTAYEDPYHPEHEEAAAAMPAMDPRQHMYPEKWKALTTDSQIIQEELGILLYEQQYVNVPTMSDTITGEYPDAGVGTHKKARAHFRNKAGKKVQYPVWKLTVAGANGRPTRCKEGQKWPACGSKTFTNKTFGKWYKKNATDGKLPLGILVGRGYISGDPESKLYAAGPIAGAKGGAQAHPEGGMIRSQGFFYANVTDQFNRELTDDEEEARREDALFKALEAERAKLKAAEKRSEFEDDPAEGEEGAGGDPEEEGVYVFGPDPKTTYNIGPGRAGTKDPGETPKPTEAEEAAEMSMPWEHPLGSGMDPTQSYIPGEEEYLQEIVLEEFKKILN
jgi:hypothetical protein